ncbi:LysM repeat protein [Dysgonomonadaceae bacterium PH5-43]|nr:LysM repeat protein [Dysgonomonadaceae bacterium PH5-43]
MSNRLLIVLFLLIYNVNLSVAFYPTESFSSQNEDFFLHTIERGQTVYSISKMYNVTENEIYQLNPGSDKGIQADSQLKIPQNSGSYIYYTIMPNDNLYSVSKKYHMKGDDIIEVNPGLSIETFTIGKIIRIPTNRVTTPLEGNEEINKQITNALLNPIRSGDDIKTIKVALLLPFNVKEGTTPQNAANNRMVEYFEGVLLALEDLKAKGISVNLQVFDTGSKSNTIPSILSKPEMQNINLIIGGLTDAQIKLMSEFASKMNIPYVIPVTSKSDEPLSKYQVYQVNTPPAYRDVKASSAFCDKYKDYNIIFYTPEDSNNKAEFIKLVQKDLTSRNIPFRTISDNNLLAEMQEAINDSTNNVFVPADDKKSVLFKLIAPIKTLKETNPELSISLFGHPSWQIYSTELSEDFFNLNASFYSVYYASPTSPAVKSFHAKYLIWYSRELINIYPKYGMLGYDTAMFFIQLLDKYGTSYDVNINKMKYSGVQSDFNFERINNWGGFINTNLYIIEYTPSLTIESKRVQ